MQTNLRSKFAMIAWGVFIPFLITVIAIIFGVIAPPSSYSGYHTLKTIMTLCLILGIIANLMCIYGSFMMIPDLNKRGIPSSGAICLGIAFSVSFVVSFFSKGSLVPLVDSVATTIIFAVIQLNCLILLIVGLSKLKEYIAGLGTALTGIWIMLGSLVGVVIFILIASGMSSYSSYRTLETLTIIVLISFIIGYIVYFCGWFSSIGGARDVDAEEIEELATEGESEMTGNATNEERMNYQASLRQLSDDQLNYIISNPSAYSANYVEEARKMLTKRQMWGTINPLGDEQLLDIVSKGVPQYSNEQCDVASMVLFTRRSPLFMAQLEGLTSADLNTMVNNPGNYYEGYVAAARDVLTRRG